MANFEWEDAWGIENSRRGLRTDRCQKCSHGFALGEGISRQGIENHVEDYERQAAVAREKSRAELNAAREVIAPKNKPCGEDHED